jgi:three-Cys-motif partner protein
MEQHQFGGPWTIKKLEVVRKYLAGYTQALKNQPFRRYYIDAFAGTGDRTTIVKPQRFKPFFEPTELDEVIKGSARVALEIDPPFHGYVFIEKRQRRSSSLQQLKAEFPARQIEVLTEDANDAVQRICRDWSWRSNRAVLFLDPYGMQVSWETLSVVARTKAIDTWILYPVGMGLNRLLTRSGQISAEWQQTIDRSLGCSNWRTVFYRERFVSNLFGDPSVERVKVAGTKEFQTFFLDRLRTIFEAVAPEAVPLLNRRGQVMYLLCFACGNPRGADIAMRIARSVMRPGNR